MQTVSHANIDHFTDRSIARQLRISTADWNMVCSVTGPRPVVVGRRTLYSAADLVLFLESLLPR
jgi:hypothetical protein